MVRPTFSNSPYRGQALQWARMVWYRTLLYDVWLRSHKPTRISFTAPDPFKGDAGNGKRLMAGRIRLGPDVVDADFTSDLFVYPAASPAWRAALHSFRWVRDLEATEQDAARLVAQEMLVGWLKRYDRWQAEAWRPDIVGRRLMSWLTHADFLLEGQDTAVRRQFSSHMGRQIRHLVTAVQPLPPGVERVMAYAGLLVAALVSQTTAAYRGTAERGLIRTLEKQVLPDGCHVTRRPDAGVECLSALIRVRAAYREIDEPFPPRLLAFVERLAPMVRFFQLGDKALAPFHGGGMDTATRISTILKLSEAKGKPPETAAHGGYYRLAAGKLTVLMDVEAPPTTVPTAWPHMAPSALHVCLGKYRLVSSCSVAATAETALDRALAQTAAHSVVVLEGQALSGMGGVTHRAFTAQEGHVLAEAAHTGYAHVGYEVRRSIYVTPEGQEIRGEETITGTEGALGPQDFSARFHLHPSAKVSLVENGRAALVRIGTAMGWRLRVSGQAGQHLALEESLYLAPDGVRRRAQQLVIRGHADVGVTVVKWALSSFD